MRGCQSREPFLDGLKEKTNLNQPSRHPNVRPLIWCSNIYLFFSVRVGRSQDTHSTGVSKQLLSLCLLSPCYGSDVFRVLPLHNSMVNVSGTQTKLKTFRKQCVLDLLRRGCNSSMTSPNLQPSEFHCALPSLGARDAASVKAELCIKQEASATCRWRPQTCCRTKAGSCLDVCPVDSLQP